MPAADGPSDADQPGDGSEFDGSESDRSRRPLSRRARARSAALWGVVGGLAVLALAQGYRLVAVEPLPAATGELVFVALAVAAASAGVAYAVEARLLAKRRT